MLSTMCIFITISASDHLVVLTAICMHQKSQNASNLYMMLIASDNERLLYGLK